MTKKKKTSESLLRELEGEEKNIFEQINKI